MSAEKKTNVEPTFEELRRAAHETMTPGERYLAALQEKQTAALHVQNAVASDMARRAVNAESIGLEKVRRADEDRVARIMKIRECSVPVDVPLELDLADAPLVQVRVELVGERHGDGPHRVTSVRWIDTSAAEALLMAACWAPWLDQKAELTKLADAAGLAALKKHVEGRSHAQGFQHRKWVSITKAILLKLIRPNGTLEDLLARGLCRQVGEIVYADAPPRGTVDP